ncbi:MAG: sensor histidine kinase [Anaerolineae bacterium]
MSSTNDQPAPDLAPLDPIISSDAVIEPQPRPMDSSNQATLPIVFSPARWRPWVAPAALIGAATLLYYILAQAFQTEIFSSPLQALTDSGTNPYLFGIAVQEVLLPLALLVILTTRPLFQQFVSGQRNRQQTRQLVLIFAVIELANLAFVFNFDDWYVTFGLVVIAAAGLIGGWRFGIAIGLMSFFVEGTLDLLNESYGNLSLLTENDWWSLFGWFFLNNVALLAKVWAGFVAAQIGRLLLILKSGIGSLFVAGIFLELVPTIFTFLVIDENYVIEPLLAGGFVSGLVVTMFMILTTNARSLAALRQAEVNQLALTQAELRALRAQINPHFLFNSLNTIRYFVRTDQDQARQLLLDLSDVFQVALKSGEFVTLREEIEFTKSYLALEKARLDERLEIAWYVQNEELLDIEVPTLFLQPVVENSVVHGIAPEPDGGRLQIMILGGGDDLVIQVIDDGVGMKPSRLELVADPTKAPEGSIGTNNIQQRLKAHYGKRGQFKVESTLGKGTTVELRVPIDPTS